MVELAQLFDGGTEQQHVATDVCHNAEAGSAEDLTIDEATNAIGASKDDDADGE